MVATVYVAAGKTLVIQLIDNSVAVATFFGAWGTGGSGTGGTATTGDTALKAEATEARVITTNTRVGTATDTNQFVWTQTNQKAGGKTIEEAGVLDASAAGNLIIRANHGSVALATGDSIQYTFTLQQT